MPTPSMAPFLRRNMALTEQVSPEEEMRRRYEALRAEQAQSDYDLTHGDTIATVTGKPHYGPRASLYAPSRARLAAGLTAVSDVEGSSVADDIEATRAAVYAERMQRFTEACMVIGSMAVERTLTHESSEPRSMLSLLGIQRPHTPLIDTLLSIQPNDFAASADEYEYIGRIKHHDGVLQFDPTLIDRRDLRPGTATPFEGGSPPPLPSLEDPQN